MYSFVSVMINAFTLQSEPAQVHKAAPTMAARPASSSRKVTRLVTSHGQLELSASPLSPKQHVEMGTRDMLGCFGNASDTQRILHGGKTRLLNDGRGFYTAWQFIQTLIICI